MGKPKVLAKKLARRTSRHSPIIFLVSGLIAGVSAIIVTVKQTAEAKDILDAEKQTKTYETKDPNAKLTKKEVIKATWKKFIPVIALTIVAVVMILSSAGIVHRRYESLAAAYGVLSASSSQYVDKVIETVGINKERAIRDDIAKEKLLDVKRNQADIKPIETDKGKTLFVDTLFGLKFYSSYEFIRAGINNLNEQLNEDPDWYVTLDDLFDEWRVNHDNAKLARSIGWTLDSGLIKVDFVHDFDSDGITPMIAISYTNPPSNIPYH